MKAATEATERMVIVAYRPHSGAEQPLLELIREHILVLRQEGLATDFTPLVLRAADGTLLEMFTWQSEEAIASSHHNPAVQALWERFGTVCEYTPLAGLPECQGPFATFTPVAL